jgi:hypothetical protein
MRNDKLGEKTSPGFFFVASVAYQIEIGYDASQVKSMSPDPHA